jgi:hypothetical protein
MAPELFAVDASKRARVTQSVDVYRWGGTVATYWQAARVQATKNHTHMP